MQGRKSLSYFLISSFLFSSFLVPYTFGMEGAESKSSVNGQKESFDSSNFSGVTGETINEFKSLDKYILDNKGSIKEEEFIGILLMVCDIVKSRLDKGDSCNHLSSQSILICCDDKQENFKIKLEAPMKQLLPLDIYVSVFRLIMMLRHLVLGNLYWRKPEKEEYYKSKYPSDEKTCGIFKDKFCKIEMVLRKVCYKSDNETGRAYVCWKKDNNFVTIPALKDELRRYI